MVKTRSLLAVTFDGTSVQTSVAAPPRWSRSARPSRGRSGSRPCRAPFIRITRPITGRTLVRWAESTCSVDAEGE